ncbi:hypothetical protein D3C86_2031080 [compost metagenome]
MSFFSASDVFDLARSSISLPNKMKKIMTAAASKYTCGCKPRACQNAGKNVLNVLKRKATPVLSATRVSILAFRC